MCGRAPTHSAPAVSLERHRLLWLYLTRETDLLKSHPRTLHIAPEVCIMRHLKPHFAAQPGRYVTADLESPLADLHFDVQRIPLADNSVDVVLCNHLLEHVADDRRALRELHRILRPGGGASSSRPWNAITNAPSKTIRSPIPTSARASSASTTTGASTARTIPTGCAKRIRGRGHRLRRLASRRGTQALRPAGRPHLRGVQALTEKENDSREVGRHRQVDQQMPHQMVIAEPLCRHRSPPRAYRSTPPRAMSASSSVEARRTNSGRKRRMAHPITR